MKITLTKKNTRAQLACQRHDGSATVSDTGPGLPFHDLAHYVVERRLRLKEGFYGMVKQGYSIQELSTKEVILSLGPESMQSEVLARALGSVATGACEVEQFEQLVNDELVVLGIPRVQGLSVNVVGEMIEEYTNLLHSYNELGDGESLVLSFDLQTHETEDLSGGALHRNITGP